MTHIWSPAFQLKPEDIDRRAVDMYSFAVILWELSTGKVPFAGLSPMQVGLKVKSRDGEEDWDGWGKMMITPTCMHNI